MTALKLLRHSQAASRPFLESIVSRTFLLLTVVFVASCASIGYGKSVNQLGATYIWLDSTIGRDSNNGSREAPLASFDGLYTNSANVNSSSVHVYLAPGFYSISHFVIEKEQTWHFNSCSDCIGTGKDVAIGLIAPDDPHFVFKTNFQHSQSQPQVFFSNLRFCPAFNSTLSHACATNLPQAPASLPVFKYPIFGVDRSGVRLENCEIRNFMLQNPLSPDFNPSIFWSTTAPFELINTDISYNYMLFDRQPYKQQDSRLLVEAVTMVIQNCTFRENRFSVPNMNGGLIQTGSLEMHNSLFIHNTGMANRGQGLLFWIELSGSKEQVSTISNCTFRDQNFEWTRGTLTTEEVMEVWNPLGLHYHLTKWSDSQQPSLTSGAVFSIVADVYLSFNMSNSICENNNASRGACVAVSTDVNSVLPIRTPSDLSQLSISNSLLTRNYASSGVGSAIYIDASFFSNITIFNVTFFVNLANVSSFTWYGPSDPLVIADPSLLYIAYASSTTIKLESITLNGTGFDIFEPAYLPTPIIETHRLYISNAQFLHLKEISFSWAVPDRFIGSYIFIRAPAFALLENIVLKPLSKNFVTPKPYPWSFIFLEGDSVQYQGSMVHIKGLWMNGWHRGYSLQVMELLQSQSIENLHMSECHINSLGSTGTSPLILIQDNTNVILEHSNFSNFQLPIVFNSIQELVLTNISIVDYSSSKAAINIEQVRETRVTYFFGNTSLASFITIQNGLKILIYDSQFYGSQPEVPSGAVTASWLQFVQVVRSEFANNQAELGPALLLNDVVDLYLFNSVFKSNLATRDGGAIMTAGGYGTIDSIRCHFLNNSALRSGGSIYTTHRLRMSESHFKGNSAGSNGGAIIRARVSAFSGAPHPNEDLTSSLRGCSFQLNRAFSKGAGLYYEATEFGINLVIEETQFEENIAGLAVDKDSSLLPYSDGLGGALYSEQSVLTIVDSSFKSNKAGSGGAINVVPRLNSPQSTITNSNFTSNHALSLGGAVTVIKGHFVPLYARVNIPVESTAPWPLTIAGCRFVTNQAEFGGGAIASIGVLPVLNIPNVFDTNKAHYGGALYVSQSSSLATLINQTFIQNTVIWGGGIVFYESVHDPQDSLLQVDLSDAQSFAPDPPREPVIPIDHSICKKSLCYDNMAKGWGNLMATGRAYLMAQTLLRSDISAISMPVELSTKPTRNVVASFLTYPGLENMISIGGTDQFGQWLKVPPDFGTVEFVCTGDCILNSQSSSVPSSYLLSPSMEKENLGIFRFRFRLDPAFLASNFTTTTGFLVYTARLPDSHGIVTETAHNIRVTVTPCGPGFGPNSKLPSECQACPLFTYSINGHCHSCASDRRIKQCSGETIESNANFWVSLNNVTGDYSAMRCPGGFCIGGNRCAMTRTGTMCGQCIKNFHESVLSECVHCSGPNWIMIAIVFLGLWATSILLHMLLAASSGKAGILIFYIQTCFVIAYVAPISDAFGLNSNGSLPSPIQFVLCLFPMNYLQRSMMYGLVPFIMMAQITVTFLIHRVIYFAVYRVRYETMLRQTHRAPPGSPPVEDSMNFEKDEEDFDEKNPLVNHDQQTHRSSTPSSKEFSEGLDSSGPDPRAVRDKEFENGDMVHLQSDFVAGTYERARYEWSRRSHFFHWFRLIRTLLSLFANSFSSILGIVMSTVGCIDLLDGERVLQAAPGVSCLSKQFKHWQQLLGLFIPYLAIVFTTLLVKLLQLYFKKRLSLMDVRFGVWYEMYRSKLFAWKLTEMVRRLCIAVASNLLIADPQLRASVLAILALIFLVIQLIARPYRQRLENILESLSLASLALLSIVILWYSRHRNITTANGAALGAWVIVITMLIVIVCGFLARKIRLWWLQRKSSK